MILETFTARWSDADLIGHIRQSVYFDYANDMRVRYLLAKLPHALKFGIIPVLFRQEIQYLKEIRMGQSFEVDWVMTSLSKDVSRWSLSHHFRIGSVLATVIQVSGAWIDIASRKLTIPPPDLLQWMQEIPRSEDFVETDESQL